MFDVAKLRRSLEDALIEVDRLEKVPNGLLRQRALDLLARSSDGLTYRGLALLLRRRHRTVHDLLKSMAAAGQVVRGDDHRWRAE